MVADLTFHVANAKGVLEELVGICLFKLSFFKIEGETKGHVRRAKLYYLRNVAGKKSRLRASNKAK